MTSDTLIYGLHAVHAALSGRGGKVTALWVDRKRQDERTTALLALAASAGIAVRRVGAEALDRLVRQQVRHQGVVAACAAVAERGEASLEQLLEAQAAAPPLLLLLDGVQDPHNLGACLRTADGAGTTAVIAPRDRAAGLTPAVRKVACGAADSVPFVQVTNIARTLRELGERGLWRVGTAGESAVSLYDADLSGPLVLVIGAEERGLRRLTREHCDQLVHIPMLGAVGSLNVSVATGICLYEALRQREARIRP